MPFIFVNLPDSLNSPRPSHATQTTITNEISVDLLSY